MENTPYSTHCHATLPHRFYTYWFCRHAGTTPYNNNDEGETRMDRYTVAALGLEPQELTILKSLLGVFAGSEGVELELVEEPGLAQISFLGHMPPNQLQELASSTSEGSLLVYCRSRDEEPMPAGDGVLVLEHCPPRSTDLNRIMEAVRARANAAPPAGKVARPSAPGVAAFAADECLASRIHTTLPKLLADQQLAVAVAGAPCLLIDVQAGVRTVHAHPTWFSHPDYWRALPHKCVLSTDAPPEKIAHCRKYPALSYRAMRFWGLMSTAAGRPLPEIAKANTVGLRKLPDFKRLPHHAWQAEIAPAMVGKQASPHDWAARFSHEIGDIIDFLNGCTGLDLLATR